MSDNNQNKKWLVIFLVYADFRTKDSFGMAEDVKAEINLLFKEILTTPINPDKSRLYVVLNGIRYKDKDTVETKTIFYEIIVAENGGKNEFGEESKIIDSAEIKAGQADRTSPLQEKDKLAAILKETHLKEDEEVLLITWDHGSAFGVFRDAPPDQIPIRITPIDEEEDFKKFPHLKQFWEYALTKDNFKKFIDKNKSTVISIKHRHDVFNIDTAKIKKLDFYKYALSHKQLRKFFTIQKRGDQITKLFFDKSAFKNIRGINIIETNNPSDEDLNNFSEVLIESTVPEILRNDELADAIECWLGCGNKVGVLLMMNCWMMNLHTMYTMLNRVKCLVAPQGDIGVPGYNIRDILKYLNDGNNTPITPQALAAVCIETTENEYAQYRFNYVFEEYKIDKKNFYFPIDYWKVFAMDLTIEHNGQSKLEYEMGLFKNIIQKTINAIKLNKFPEMKYLLKYVRSLSFNFMKFKNKDNNVDSLLIDIINWCFCVVRGNKPFDTNGRFVMPSGIKNDISFFLKQVLTNKEDLTPTIVIKATSGSKVYNKIGGNKLDPIAVINLPPTGYGLFFPLYEFTDIRLIDNVKNDRFLKCYLTNWGDFLKNAINDKIESKSLLFEKSCLK